MPLMEMQKITSKEVLGMIFQALEQSSQMGWISQVSMQATSTSASERYAWLGHAPMLREWKGPRKINKLAEYDYTLLNKKYEDTLGVAIDDLDREKVGQLRIRIADMAAREQTHWASLITSLIDSNGVCYDGQNFFDTDHSDNNSGTLSNAVTSSQYSSLNIGTAGEPTAAEASALVMDLISHFYTLKDDQGEPINENAKSFIVLCPTVKMFNPVVTAISKATITTSGGAAVDNPMMGNGLQIQAFLNTRFTSTWANYLWVFRADAPVKAFIRQQEGGVTTQALDEGSDHAFFNDELLFGLKVKRAAGYGFWQYAVRGLTS